MKPRHLLIAAIAWSLCGSAQAIDEITTAKGKHSGTIQSITSIEVAIDQGGTKGVATVPVNEIASLRFDKEPANLNILRNQARAGQHKSALKGLRKIDAAKIERAEIKTDVEFFTALATARAAMAGAGTIKDAGKLMNAFIKEHETSHHFFLANEVVGDLLVADDKFEEAEKFYMVVERQAPWPDFKMRAGVAKGRTLLKQNKGPEALGVFDEVIALAAGSEGPLVTRQRMLATVGKANAMCMGDQFDEGVKLVDALIAEVEPEDAEVHALAYNALGNCHRKANRLKEARMAFLHVDLLYSQFPEAHAEALANLAELWNELGDAERAAQAKSDLTTKYPDSSWAKKKS